MVAECGHIPTNQHVKRTGFREILEQAALTIFEFFVQMYVYLFNTFFYIPAGLWRFLLRKTVPLRNSFGSEFDETLIFTSEIYITSIIFVSTHSKDTIPKIRFLFLVPSLPPHVCPKGQTFPEKELRPQSQCPLSSVWERLIFSHDRKIWWPILGIYKSLYSQTHECGNLDWGWAIPFQGNINGIFVAVQIFYIYKSIP